MRTFQMETIGVVISGDHCPLNPGQTMRRQMSNNRTNQNQPTPQSETTQTNIY